MLVFIFSTVYDNYILACTIFGYLSSNNWGCTYALMVKEQIAITMQMICDARLIIMSKII